MRHCLFVLIFMLCVAPAMAQENARQEAARRASAISSLPPDAARRLFGVITTPTAAPAQPIGFYSRGCFTGGVALPEDGDTWQAMRLSRNRYWGTPRLIAFLDSFSAKAAAATGWPGILVGDMSQPRGGPMLTGHASHQLGIEADIWMKPMPARRYGASEREEISSTDLVRKDRLDINPATYTPQHVALLRLAAKQPGVARIFVNAAIKKALCRDAGTDRAWLSKIRPMWGHNYHFHIRLACLPGEAACTDQAPPPKNDGCGKELDWWFTDEALNPKPGKPGPPLTMAGMPAQCQAVLNAR